MKIAFDEHVPDAMYRIFDSLIAERKMRRLIGAAGRGRTGGYTIVRSRDYSPFPRDPDYIKGSDVPWIAKFARDGGRVIISGNVEMMHVPQEVIAIQQAGLIAFYFQPKWNGWNFFKKSSLLIWHWESVIKTVSAASPGDVYRIPAAFRDFEALNRVIRAGQWEMLTESPHTTHPPAATRKERVRKPSSSPSGPAEQGRLHFGADA